MDGWDPRREDYQSRKFNSYDRGPGRNLPAKSSAYGGGVQLYVRGIPNEVTEEGIRNLFMRAGTVTRVKKCVSKKETGDTFGFVTMATLGEAEEAIRQYDQFKLGQFALKVTVALSDDEKSRRVAVRKEEEEFLETLQSFKTEKTEKPSSDSDVESIKSGSTAVKPLTNGIGGGGDASSSKGAGRGRILHQLTGLYQDPRGAVGNQPSPGLRSHAAPSGDMAATNADQYQSDSGKKDKKADVSSLYSVENLKITTDCDEKKSVAGTGSVAVVLRKQFDAADTDTRPQRDSGLGRQMEQDDRPPGRGRGRGHRGRSYTRRGERHDGYGRGERHDGYGRGYQRYHDYYEEHRPGYSSGYGYPQQQPPLIDPRMPPLPPLPYIGMPMGYPPPMMGAYPAVPNPYLLQPAPLATPMPRPDVMNSTVNYGSMPDTSMAHGRDSEKPLIGLCSACGRGGSLRCSCCKAPYCSETCQAKDWPAHKKVCKLLQKENEVESAFDIEVGDDIIPVVKHMMEQKLGEPLEMKKNVRSPKSKKVDTPQLRKQNAEQSDNQSMNKNTGRSSDQPRNQNAGQQQRKCFKCNKEGHISRDCPQGKSRGDRRGQRDNQRDSSQVEARNGLDAAPSRQMTAQPPPELKPKIPSPAGFNVKPPMLVEFTPFPLNKEVQVAVTEVTSPSQVWVQLVQEDNINALRELMDKLTEKYSNSSPDIQVVNIGEIYATQFSDGSWYRAKVVATKMEKVKLHYIDFGNDDVTTAAQLRQLDSSLLKFQAQAIALSIGGISPPGGETKWHIPRETLDNLVPPNVLYNAIASTCRTSAEGWMVYTVKMTTETGEDIAEKFVSMGLTDSATKKTPPKQKLSETCQMKGKSPETGQPKSKIAETTETAEQKSKSPEKESAVTMAKVAGSVAREVKVGQELQVTLTHAANPATFTVQIIATEKIEAFNKFNDKLNTVYNKESVTPHRPTQVGELVVAKFSGYDGWFRGEITKLLDERALVYYIDFGNSEEVKVDDLRKAVPFISSDLPAQAMTCELYGVEPPTEWKDTIVQEFARLCDMPNGGAVRSIVKTVAGDTVTLDLFSKDGKSVGTELVALLSPKAETKVLSGATANVPKADGSPKVKVTAVEQPSRVEIKPTALPLNGVEVMATVSFVYGMDSFFMVPQDGQIQQQLNVMMAELNQMCEQSKTAHSPVEGEFIAAQFTDEGCTLWYRAKILAMQDDGMYKVLFVDYGNSESVAREVVRRLDPRLAELPQAAVHCRLPATTPDTEVQQVFRGIVNTPFKVKATRTIGDVYVVDLYLEDGKNLTEMLLGGSEATKETNPPPPPQPLPMEVLNTVKMPLDGSRVDAETMAIESLSLFYVQLRNTDLQAHLNMLMSNLNTKPYQVTGTYDPVPGEYIAAQFTDPSGGTLWYRAQLKEKVQGEDKIYKVFYVDYGNTDVVSLKSIRRLDSAARTDPLMAVACKLAGYSESTHAEKNKDFGCILNQAVEIKVVAEKPISENESLYAIEMFLPDGDKTCVNVVLFPDYEISRATTVVKSARVSKPAPSEPTQPSKSVVKPPSPVAAKPKPEPVEKEIAKTSSAETVTNSDAETTTASKAIAENQCQLPADGSSVDVVIAHIETLGCFYVQLMDVDMHRNLASLSMELMTKFQAVSGAYEPTIGETVAAQYSEAGEVIWYRARCLNKVANGRYKLQFVDYGNTETVNTDSIQKLDATFCKLPFMSVKCCLAGSTGLEGEVPVNGLRDYLNCQMKLIVQKYVKDTYHVELYNEGKSVHAVLGVSMSPPSPKAASPKPSTEIVSQFPKPVTPKKEALPRKDVSPSARTTERKVVFTQTVSRNSPAEGAEFVAVVTNVSSPGLFHCQQVTPELLQSLDLLNQTIKMESEAITPSADITYQIGELCCAQFPDDGNWYRAGVQEVFPDQSVQVEFVDYGNQANVPASLLRPITNNYVELPIMAFKCSLSGVKPVSGSSWNEGAATTLAKFTEKPLNAHVISVNSDVFEMELFDSQENVSISEHLIASNVAKSSLAPAEASPDAGASSEMDLLKQQNKMLQQEVMLIQKQMTQLMAHVTKQ